MSSEEEVSDDRQAILRRRTLTGGTCSTTATGPPPEEESDSETGQTVQPSERTRQKKFSKYFKDLPSEVCTVRISCALVGDILLQGHLYVTHNYIGFHSNVFGYVTKIKLLMTSVTAITKEKTAKIIPNAVAVCTETEKHIFTSFMSRDATFNTVTKAWRRALARNNIDNLTVMKVDTMDGRTYDSTDSETSTNPGWRVTRSSLMRLKNRMPGSNTGYNTLAGSEPSSSLQSSVLLLSLLICLLMILLISSLYLVLRLGYIQDRMEEAVPQGIPDGHADNWQNILSSKSNKKVQEYLDNNLDQISKVRENLEKLSSILVRDNKRDEH